MVTRKAVCRCPRSAPRRTASRRLRRGILETLPGGFVRWYRNEADDPYAAYEAVWILRPTRASSREFSLITLEKRRDRAYRIERHEIDLAEMDPVDIESALNYLKADAYYARRPLSDELLAGIVFDTIGRDFTIGGYDATEANYEDLLKSVARWD